MMMPSQLSKIPKSTQTRYMPSADTIDGTMSGSSTRMRRAGMTQCPAIRQAVMAVAVPMATATIMVSVAITTLWPIAESQSEEAKTAA